MFNELTKWFTKPQKNSSRKRIPGTLNFELQRAHVNILFLLEVTILNMNCPLLLKSDYVFGSTLCF